MSNAMTRDQKETLRALAEGAIIRPDGISERRDDFRDLISQELIRYDRGTSRFTLTERGMTIAAEYTADDAQAAKAEVEVWKATAKKVQAKKDRQDLWGDQA